MKNCTIKLLSATFISALLLCTTSCQQDDDTPTPIGIEIQSNAKTSTINQSRALLAILNANPELKSIGWNSKTDPKQWPGVTSINNVVRELAIHKGLTALPPEIRGLKYLKRLTNKLPRCKHTRYLVEEDFF